MTKMALLGQKGFRINREGILVNWLFRDLLLRLYSLSGIYRESVMAVEKKKEKKEKGKKEKRENRGVFL